MFGKRFSPLLILAATCFIQRVLHAERLASVRRQHVNLCVTVGRHAVAFEHIGVGSGDFEVHEDR